MAFKMKYGKGGFPYKSESPMKQKLDWISKPTNSKPLTEDEKAMNQLKIDFEEKKEAKEAWLRANPDKAKVIAAKEAEAEKKREKEYREAVARGDELDYDVYQPSFHKDDSPMEMHKPFLIGKEDIKGVKQGFKDMWANITGGKTHKEKSKTAERHQELRDMKKYDPEQFKKSSKLYPDAVYDPDAKKDQRAKK